MNEFYTDVSRKFNDILYRGIDSSGRKIYQKVRYTPTMYLESKDKDALWHTLDGTPVEPMKFDSMSECRTFQKQYEDLKSFNIYGNDRHPVAFLQQKFPDEIQYDSKHIDICYLDIENKISESGSFSEPTVADQEITLIGLKSSKSNNYIQWGLKDYDKKKSIVSHIKVEYRQFNTEFDMLSDFISFWSDPMTTPNVITGWNTKLYDIPYLVNRLSRILGSDEAKRLSPWNTIEQRTATIDGQERTSFTISGIQQLDYIDLFKKFCLNTYGQQESYKLDYIADLVLGEGKINYGESGYSNLTELYNKDHSLYCDYNLVDIELIIKLEEKLGLLNLVFTLSYYSGTNYNDTLGTVAIWDAIIFRYLAKKHIAIPQNKMSFKTDYEGGFVKESQKGRHKWLMTYDLNSLYPMTIVQYNMSPETIVPYMKVQGLTPEKILNNQDIKQWSPEANLVVGANGCCFRKDKQGFLPALMEQIYNRRVTIKSAMITAQKELEITDKKTKRHSELLIEIDRYNNEQMGIKILLNSLYGSLANRFCRYYNIDIAEAITLSGQLAVQTAEAAVNKFLSIALHDTTPKDRVIMGDTDSIAISLSDVVKKCNPKDTHNFLLDFGKTSLEPVIEKAYADLAFKMNAYKNTAVMKTEKICDSAIIQAKKRYIFNVLSSEGVVYNEPKIVMKGIEAVKSSTPKICRTEFKKLFKILLTAEESEIQNEVERFRLEFENEPIEKMAFPRGVTNVKKYTQKIGANGIKVPYVKGTPMNSRSAIMYNHLVKTMGLNQYQYIKGGDRIKFVFLRKGNPTGENVIAFLDKLPPEFELHTWIDYELLFSKTFIEPLQLILTSIGWKAITTSSLDDFFC